LLRHQLLCLSCDAGKINASDKILHENQKKRENMEIKEFFLHKSPSKRPFRHRIHSLLRRAHARGIVDITYRSLSDAYRQFAGQAYSRLVIEVRK